MLDDSNHLVQACAIDEAVERDLREAVGPLRAMLESGGSVTPQRLLAALGRLGDATLVPLIEKHLTHTDPEVREASLQALESIGEANLEVVARALQPDDSAETVRLAFRVAQRVGGAEGVASLWKGLSPQNRLLYLETGVELASGTVWEAEAVARAALRDADERVRELACSLHRKTIAWRAREEHPELFRPRTPGEPDPEPQVLRTRFPRDLQVELRGGGSLRITPGVVALTLVGRVEAAHDEETGVRATLFVGLADRDGVLWRLAFVLPLSRFVTLSTRTDLRCVYWTEAEDAWRAAFSQAPLFRGVAGMRDDREYLEFHVGDDRGDLRVKYLSATFDGAVFQEEPEGEAWLLVLTKELIDASGADIPPFVVRLPLPDLLAQPQVTWTLDPETNDEEEHRGAVAERLSDGIEPQAHVSLEPNATA
jgi:hypothetical protein